MAQKKVGAKPKYKEGVETTTIHVLVPSNVKSQCLEAIDKLVQSYKNIQW